MDNIAFEEGDLLMRKNKYRLQGVIIGVLITTIMVTCIQNMAAGINQKIDVVLNSINIAVNYNPVKTDNILYDGTTYVPLRTISEMLGKDVIWDSETNTANINDRKIPEINKNTSSTTTNITNDSQSTKDSVNINNNQNSSTSNTIKNDKADNPNKYGCFSGYSNILFKVDDKGLYEVKNIVMMQALYMNYKDCKYYFDLQYMDDLLNVLAGSYNIEKSNNPYLTGLLNIKQRYKLETKWEYLNISTTYMYGSIKDTLNNKSYNFTFKPGEEKGAVKVRAGEVFPIDDVLECFGYKDKYKIELDKVNKCIIFDIIK